VHRGGAGEGAVESLRLRVALLSAVSRTGILVTRLSCSFVAYVLLAGLLFCRNRGAYLPSQIFFAVVALAMALTGAFWSSTRRGHAGRVLFGLGLFVMAELAFLFFASEKLVGPSEPLSRGTRYGLIVIATLVLSYGWAGMPGARWRFPALAAVWVGITAAMVATWSPPPTDVWEFQTESLGHLLHGEDPYAAEYRNPFPHRDYYSDTILKGDMIQSFPYTPVGILLVAPGYFAGDVRWALLAATVLATACMVAAGRWIGLPPGHPAELAAVAVLCHPQAWFVLQTSWNEPLVALSIAAGVWALAAERQRLAGIAMAVTIVAKQYGVLWLPAAWATGRLSWRKTLPWIFLGMLTFVPFLIWHPRAIYRGMVEFQLTSPFRVDSLSVPALVAIFTGNGHHNSGYHIPAAVGFIAAAVVIVLLLRRPAPDLSRAVLGAGATFFAFFLFNKSSHLNYYWLVESLLAFATLLSLAELRAQSIPVHVNKSQTLANGDGLVEIDGREGTMP
jgi:hypothetical protein